MKETERFKKNGPVRLVTFLGKKNSVAQPFCPETRPLIGVLEGTGIGPEVIGATLQILKSTGQALDLDFEVRHGGLIGEEAVAEHGKWLPEDTAEFCADIFHRGGLEMTWLGRRFESMAWGFCLVFDRHNETHRCRATFDARIYHPVRVRNWISRFEKFLRVISENPGSTIAELLAMTSLRSSSILSAKNFPGHSAVQNAQGTTGIVAPDDIKTFADYIDADEKRL